MNTPRLRGFTLMEMMIVMSLVSLALIPLFRWQTFLMDCLRIQTDTTTILSSHRRVVQQFDRDVTSAVKLLPSTGDQVLVLENYDGTQVIYTLNTDPNSSNSEQVLTRSLTNPREGIQYTGTPLASYVETCDISVANLPLVEIRLATKAEWGPHLQSQTMTTKSLLGGGM